MSSKGDRGRANQDGAWGDKGNYQKGTGASGAEMSPPCTFQSSHDNNDMWIQVPVEDGNSRGRVLQCGNDEEGSDIASPLLLAHIHGGRKGNGGDKTWDQEETDIVDGTWPGVLDSSLLTHFIAYHFAGDAEAYLPFSCWANSHTHGDPNVTVCIEEWLFLH